MHFNLNMCQANYVFMGLKEYPIQALDDTYSSNFGLVTEEFGPIVKPLSSM